MTLWRNYLLVENKEERVEIDYVIVRFVLTTEYLQNAKVNYCKHRITLRQLIDVMNHSDKMCDKISNKISELTKDLNELDK